ncbi:hypothetical protein [Aestuariivivens marinum]|uniref:hypothetical protein n=1 Tax=Aestuariivivens marinum TaxID=2913555 RepID=UPI001F55D9DB|nr:hypothetical protein [Aestuariivivens marinum]
MSIKKENAEQISLIVFARRPKGNEAISNLRGDCHIPLHSIRSDGFFKMGFSTRKCHIERSRNASQGSIFNAFDFSAS